MIRSVRERVIQTITFEIVALALTVPLFSLWTQSSHFSSMSILVFLSLLITLWSGIHNSLFDWIEWQFTQRTASNRPNRLRLIHAISLEASATLVSLPVLVWLLDMNWRAALLLDVSLTLLYVIYGFVFHRIYDEIRPVKFKSLME